MKLSLVRNKIFDPVTRAPVSFQDKRIQECVEYGGSKLGVALAIQSSFTPELERLKQYLPKSYLQESGDTVASLKEKIEREFQVGKLYTIRTGSPYDYSGLTGVLPYNENNVSKERADKKNALERTLDVIEHCFIYNPNEYLAKHLGLNPNEIDLEIKLLIQEYIPENAIAGSIVEHPHRKNYFYIYLPGLGKQFTFTAPPRNNASEYRIYRLVNAKRLKYFESIITLYKEAQDAGLIPDGYTGQVSFKLDTSKNKPYLLQVRIFRKKEQRADFDIDTKRNENIFIGFEKDAERVEDLLQSIAKKRSKKTRSTPVRANSEEISANELITHTSFGITPSGGIEIDLGDLLMEKETSENAKYYDSFDEREWFRFIVNSSRAPVICGNLDFLRQSSFGYVQRSKVAVITDRPATHDYFDFIREVYNTANTRKIRIFSNGVCGKVEPV